MAFAILHFSKKIKNVTLVIHQKIRTVVLLVLPKTNVPLAILDISSMDQMFVKKILNIAKKTIDQENVKNA